LSKASIRFAAKAAALGDGAPESSTADESLAGKAACLLDGRAISAAPEPAELPPAQLSLPLRLPLRLRLRLMLLRLRLMLLLREPFRVASARSRAHA
jgi:hypothetical protein